MGRAASGGKRWRPFSVKTPRRVLARRLPVCSLSNMIGLGYAQADFCFVGVAEGALGKWNSLPKRFACARVLGSFCIKAIANENLIGCAALRCTV